ncbi:RNA polymerase sigma factor [Antarcticibacterium flavum]|uniref:RNA polymerase sigma factor n=1 Tax=Antarcticibacterium flavum TaxID=2058175 RepID=A0A5B7X108_9FLAO|nr:MULTISPECIES: RNA polymerase sigma factor [Antarcticibacterium]MCM4161205.1 RNA polymerase subunit sigma [Antarcticibacterium sp. W02-3]QCY68293.1 RNA polymerase sigma factor [Antarcticibacterium flavum]
MTPTITYIDELVVRCRQGDQRAQMEIYNKYYKAMYNTALRIVKDPAEAEDVMQEAFIKAFSKINSFQGKSTFGAWLKKITVNLSIISFNKQSKFQNVSYEDQFKYETEEAQGVDIKEEETNSKVKRILKAMKGIKESYQIALNLHLIEGYDYEEICEILEISSANCRTLISRAKESLRNKLLEYEV